VNLFGKEQKKGLVHKNMKIEIGSTVRFIWKNVNWQGIVNDIIDSTLCISVLGYSQMFYLHSDFVLLLHINE
jgi:hypothetical protein